MTMATKDPSFIPPENSDQIDMNYFIYFQCNIRLENRPNHFKNLRSYRFLQRLMEMAEWAHQLKNINLQRVKKRFKPPLMLLLISTPFIITTTYLYFSGTHIHYYLPSYTEYHPRTHYPCRFFRNIENHRLS